jgi:cobalt-zinc-cadmium efflux system outer membrane protein
MTAHPRISTCIKRIVFTSVVCMAQMLSPGLVVAAETLTLEKAIIDTLVLNPDLEVFGYAMRAQDGRILQASLAPKPELNITVEDVLGTGAAQGLQGAQTTASISWVAEGDLRQRRVDAARMGSLALAADAEIMRLDVAAETARLYTEALAQQLRRGIADKAVELAEEIVASVQQRVNASITLSSELSRAQAEHARRVLYREDFDHEIQAAYHRLAAQWGEVNPQFSMVIGDPLILPTLEPFDTLMEGVEQSPDLTRYLSETRLQEAIVQLEKIQGKSLWRFNAGVRRMENSSDMGFVAGVTIPLDRGNRNQGRINEARATLEQTAAREKATRVHIQTTLLVIYLELEHSLHRAEVLRTDVMPRFELALAEIRRAYDLGSASYLEWLQVQEELLDVRSELAETSVQAHLKLIEIERITGMRVTQSTPSQ